MKIQLHVEVKADVRLTEDERVLLRNLGFADRAGLWTCGDFAELLEKIQRLPNPSGNSFVLECIKVASTMATVSNMFVPEPRIKT